MDAETIYEVARCREHENPDALIDRVQLLRNSDGSLTLRHAGGRETRCAGDDALAVIAGNKKLNGVRPNEMMQIRGTEELCAELPLLLRALDEDAALDSFEVYVNHAFWGAVRGADRMWVIPCDDVNKPRLDDEWARISLTGGGFTSGTTTSWLGSLTPTVVADFYDPDCADSCIAIARRGDDAEMITDWLLSGQLSQDYFVPRLLTQLFIETAKNPENSVQIDAERLGAGIGDSYENYGGSAADIWAMRLALNTGVTDAVLTRLRERGGQIAAIVDGWLNPDSPVGRERVEALERLQEQERRFQRDRQRKRDQDDDGGTRVTQRLSNIRPLTTTTARRPRRPSTR